MSLSAVIPVRTAGHVETDHGQGFFKRNFVNLFLWMIRGIGSDFMSFGHVLPPKVSGHF